MMTWLGAVIVAVCAIPMATAGTHDMPSWAIDPAKPGLSPPPAGRSLFDFVAADGIPFPFEALVRKVEASAGCAPGACVKSVLIPLGRSLQRTAAAPDFFAFPRVVVAVTDEGAGPHVCARSPLSGLPGKGEPDRGHQLQRGGGAFRVPDRARLSRRRRRRGSSTPVATCARPAIRITAPIFSRPVWDETNANPRIAARLSAEQKPFYGIPVHRGVDIPNAIDDATDRANAIAVTQRIWREACDAGCRSAALTAALQYRLSGERGFDAPDLAPALARGFAARWPAGLAIPNPDLPNRDPLAFVPGSTGVAQSHVAAGLEPLAPRAPLEVWTAEDRLLARRFVMGLADLIAETDMRELEATLARRARGFAAPDSQGRLRDVGQPL